LTGSLLPRTGSTSNRDDRCLDDSIAAAMDNLRVTLTTVALTTVCGDQTYPTLRRM